MPTADVTGRSIRQCLRDATSNAHARLDDQLGPLALGSMDDYAAFLAIQYRARIGIEAWLSGQSLDMVPPPQAALIASDLAALGFPATDAAPAFAPAEQAQPLGVCWVLAGSSLGNRAILARFAGDTSNRPASFLSDTSMTIYWRDLLPRLQAPLAPGMESTLVAGAQAAFAHFLAVAAACPLREAA